MIDVSGLPCSGFRVFPAGGIILLGIYKPIIRTLRHSSVLPSANLWLSTTPPQTHFAPLHLEMNKVVALLIALFIH